MRTLVVTADDVGLHPGMTLGALRALRGHPAPPALVGFDEVDLGDVLGVSVVAHDPEDMGRRAAELLLDRIDGHRGQARQVVVPTRLLARTLPRIACTRCLTIARPSPVPPSSRERALSTR